MTGTIKTFGAFLTIAMVVFGAGGAQAAHGHGGHGGGRGGGHRGGGGHGGGHRGGGHVGAHRGGGHGSAGHLRGGHFGSRMAAGHVGSFRGAHRGGLGTVARARTISPAMGLAHSARGMAARPGMTLAGRSFGISAFGRAGVNSFGRAVINNGAMGLRRNGYGYGYGGYGYGSPSYGGYGGYGYGYPGYGAYGGYGGYGGYGYGYWPWLYGSSLYNWGYSRYYNPYYGYGGYGLGAFGYPGLTTIIVQPAVYDYSQPLSTQAAPPEPAAVDKVGTSFDTARDAFKAGDYLKALKLTDEAIRQMPNDAALHEFRGLVLFALYRYEDAAAPLYAVLSVRPGWDWKTLVGLYPSVSVYTEQLRALETYCRLNPRSASARFVLAYLYLTQGNTDAAVDQLKRVVALQPKDTVAARLLEQLDKTNTPPAAGVVGQPPPQAPRPDWH